MVFGPNMQNFEPIARAFVEEQGAVQVANAAELETALANILESPERAAHLGANALKVVHANIGAIDRTLDMLVKHLEGSEIYIAPKR